LRLLGPVVLIPVASIDSIGVERTLMSDTLGWLKV
jgi:hypothetical protein